MDVELEPAGRQHLVFRRDFPQSLFMHQGYISVVSEIQHDFPGLRFMKFLKWELV